MGVVASSFPRDLSAEAKNNLGFGGPAITVLSLNILGERSAGGEKVLAVCVDILAPRYAWHKEYIDTLGDAMNRMGLWREVVRHRVRRCAIFRFNRPDSYEADGETATELLVFCRPALSMLSEKERRFARLFAKAVRDCTLQPLVVLQRISRLKEERDAGNKAERGTELDKHLDSERKLLRDRDLHAAVENMMGAFQAAYNRRRPEGWMVSDNSTLRKLEASILRQQAAAIEGLPLDAYAASETGQTEDAIVDAMREARPAPVAPTFEDARDRKGITEGIVNAIKKEHGFGAHAQRLRIAGYVYFS